MYFSYNLNYLDAYERYILGWINPNIITNSGTFQIRAVLDQFHVLTNSSTVMVVVNTYY